MIKSSINLCVCLFTGITLVIVAFLSGCTKHPDIPATRNSNEQLTNLQIAFMPDIHFHDIYGKFSATPEGDKKIFPKLTTTTPEGIQYATIRSMRAQLHSTRLFNENYFALIAALDDIARRGIKYVALPGDFSDDGQPLHLGGLGKILDRYQRDYDIQFFAAPGNHDPTRPFSHAAGKMDYLGEHGKEQPVFSLEHTLCRDAASATEQGIICSDDVMELGYEPIMQRFAHYGFYPQKHYHYYETPFSNYLYQDYSFAQAQEQARFSNRQYEICHQGSGESFKKAHYTQCHWLADSSYLVEPVTGLWLLAIDANVYQPVAQSADQFGGSGDAGYNKILTHKAHLVPWLKDIVMRAQQQNKTLIAFSHFPMQEFYKGASDNLAQLFGDDSFQLSRRPEAKTSQLLADTGLKIHVGGHMHMNDTGIIRTATGKVLFNIQAPSLAAYVPAYKLLTLKGSTIEVETVQINDVPRFNELFNHYREEWHHLQQTQPEKNWDRSILTAKTYREFTEWHLRELVRLRFLPQEWPKELRSVLPQLTGQDLLILSQLQETIDISAIFPAQAWQEASKRTEQWAWSNSINLDNFSKWSGTDLLLDFYKLCNAGQLALTDINKTRLQDYRVLLRQLKDTAPTTRDNHSTATDDQTTYFHQTNYLRHRIQEILEILLQFNQGLANKHVLLDMDAGTLEDLAVTE